MRARFEKIVVSTTFKTETCVHILNIFLISFVLFYFLLNYFHLYIHVYNILQYDLKGRLKYRYIKELYKNNPQFYDSFKPKQNFFY